VAFACTLEFSSAWATPTTHGGENYDQVCFDNGVPMPPDFFPPGGPSLWHFNGSLSDRQSFTGANRFIYFFESNGSDPTPDSPFNGVTSPNPPGLCTVNLAENAGDTSPSEINVLCQGVNGKTCFWRWPGFPPLDFAAPNGPLTHALNRQMISPRISSRNGNDFEVNTTFNFGCSDTDPSCDTGTSPACDQSTGAKCIRAFAGGDEHGFNDEGPKTACSSSMPART
jgi:hypothetical protein